MARYAALLRGINVGGKNKLPMKELSALFVAAGCADVVTYIQSGNVVFSAARALAHRIPTLIHAGIAKERGFDVPVVVRSATELERVLVDNPFAAAGEDADTLHVAFLADAPAPSRVAALDPSRSPGDRFVVRGNDVYLHLPNGVARTKLTNAWFDAQLATVSTLRNWRTVQKLRELTQTGG